MIVPYVKVGILSHQLSNSPLFTENKWWAGAWSDVGKETGIYYVIIYMKCEC
jgi:alpha-L-fucosidase